jgi:hypothetical protein
VNLEMGRDAPLVDMYVLAVEMLVGVFAATVGIQFSIKTSTFPAQLVCLPDA